MRFLPYLHIFSEKTTAIAQFSEKDTEIATICRAFAMFGFESSVICNKKEQIPDGICSFLSFVSEKERGENLIFFTIFEYLYFNWFYNQESL